MSKRIEVVAVACTAYDGSPAMCVYAVECTQQDYDEGEHYEKAKRMAMKERYAGPWICFDESEHSEIKRAAKAL